MTKIFKEADLKFDIYEKTWLAVHGNKLREEILKEEKEVIIPGTQRMTAKTKVPC